MAWMQQWIIRSAVLSDSHTIAANNIRAVTEYAVLRLSSGGSPVAYRRWVSLERPKFSSKMNMAGGDGRKRDPGGSGALRR